ncbi:hypothetical protein QTP88_003454 [Uroleucon formosanum]
METYQTSVQFPRNVKPKVANFIKPIDLKSIGFSLFNLRKNDRSFLVANAQQAGCNIIYCSDGFCHMTGYSRAEVMQCPAICEFLQGPMTSQHAVSVVKEALAAGMERHFEILYYRKDENIPMMIV